VVVGDSGLSAGEMRQSAVQAVHWGRRRTRVSECAGIVKAENVNTALMREGASAAGLLRSR
jgi:hypothetical protein